MNSPPISVLPDTTTNPQKNASTPSNLNRDFDVTSPNGSSIELDFVNQVYYEFVWTGTVVKTAFLAGSFEKWTKNIPLEKVDGFHRAIVALEPGSYTYKYIIDGDWKHDPEMPTKTDEAGNVNNILEIKGQDPARELLTLSPLDPSVHSSSSKMLDFSSIGHVHPSFIPPNIPLGWFLESDIDSLPSRIQLFRMAFSAQTSNSIKQSLSNLLGIVKWDIPSSEMRKTNHYKFMVELPSTQFIDCIELDFGLMRSWLGWVHDDFAFNYSISIAYHSNSGWVDYIRKHNILHLIASSSAAPLASTSTPSSAPLSSSSLSSSTALSKSTALASSNGDLSSSSNIAPSSEKSSQSVDPKVRKGFLNVGIRAQKLCIILHSENKSIKAPISRSSCLTSGISCSEFQQHSKDSSSSPSAVSKSCSSKPSLPRKVSTAISSASVSWRKQFTYSGEQFDKQGLLYWLGTNEGRDPVWQNPALTGKLRLEISHSKLAGQEMKKSNIVARSCGESTFWGGSTPLWFMIDLGPYYRFCPNHYTLRHGHASANSYIRDWEFQASNDGAEWIKLHGQIESPFTTGFDSQSFPVTEQSEFYRYFRILQKGNYSPGLSEPDGSPYLCAGGFELYGELATAAAKPSTNFLTSARLSLLSLTPLSLPTDIKEFKHVSDFDTNGILYHIATDGNAEPYQNPSINGRIELTLSHRDLHSQEMSKHSIIARSEPAATFWGGTSPQWVVIDLKSNRVLVTDVTIRHGYSAANSYLKDWTFEGSADSQHWVNLYSSPEAPFTRGFDTFTFHVEDGKDFFRYFRVKQAGNYSMGYGASGGSPYICVGGIELYGKFTGNHAVAVSGATSVDYVQAQMRRSIRQAYFSNTSFHRQLLLIVQSPCTDITKTTKCLNMLTDIWTQNLIPPSQMLAALDLAAFVTNSILHAPPQIITKARHLLGNAMLVRSRYDLESNGSSSATQPQSQSSTTTSEDSSMALSTQLMDILLNYIEFKGSDFESMDALDACFDLLSKVSDANPNRIHSACTKCLLDISHLIYHQRNAYYNILRAHFGLSAFVLEPAIFGNGRIDVDTSVSTSSTNNPSTKKGSSVSLDGSQSDLVTSAETVQDMQYIVHQFATTFNSKCNDLKSFLDDICAGQHPNFKIYQEEVKRLYTLCARAQKALNESKLKLYRLDPSLKSAFLKESKLDRWDHIAEKLLQFLNLQCGNTVMEGSSSAQSVMIVKPSRRRATIASQFQHTTDYLLSLFNILCVFASPVVREQTIQFVSPELGTYIDFPSAVLSTYYCTPNGMAMFVDLAPEEMLFKAMMAIMAQDRLRYVYVDSLFDLISTITSSSSESDKTHFISDTKLLTWSLLLMSNLTKSNNDPPHFGTKCRACSMAPIRGIRYRCTNCIDYDICAECEADIERQHDIGHLFIKIPFPLPLPPSPLLSSASPREPILQHILYPDLSVLSPPSASKVLPGFLPMIHAGFHCNFCRTSSITGIRYMCSQCDNYNLCESCEAKSPHTATHLFLKIVVPLPAPSATEPPKAIMKVPLHKGLYPLPQIPPFANRPAILGQPMKSQQSEMELRAVSSNAPTASVQIVMDSKPFTSKLSNRPLNSSKRRISSPKSATQESEPSSTTPLTSNSEHRTKSDSSSKSPLKSRALHSTQQSSISTERPLTPIIELKRSGVPPLPELPKSRQQKEKSEVLSELPSSSCSTTVTAVSKKQSRKDSLTTTSNKLRPSLSNVNIPSNVASPSLPRLVATKTEAVLLRPEEELEYLQWKQQVAFHERQRQNLRSIFRLICTSVHMEPTNMEILFLSSKILTEMIKQEAPEEVIEDTLANSDLVSLLSRVSQLDSMIQSAIIHLFDTLCSESTYPGHNRKDLPVHLKTAKVILRTACLKILQLKLQSLFASPSPINHLNPLMFLLEMALTLSQIETDPFLISVPAHSEVADQLIKSLILFPPISTHQVRYWNIVLRVLDLVEVQNLLTHSSALVKLVAIVVKSPADFQQHLEHDLITLLAKMVDAPTGKEIPAIKLWEAANSILLHLNVFQDSPLFNSVIKLICSWVLSKPASTFYPFLPKLLCNLLRNCVQQLEFQSSHFLSSALQLSAKLILRLLSLPQFTNNFTIAFVQLMSVDGTATGTSSTMKLVFNRLWNVYQDPSINDSNSIPMFDQTLLQIMHKLAEEVTCGKLLLNELVKLAAVSDQTFVRSLVIPLLKDASLVDYYLIDLKGIESIVNSVCSLVEQDPFKANPPMTTLLPSSLSPSNTVPIEGNSSSEIVGFKKKHMAQGHFNVKRLAKLESGFYNLTPLARLCSPSSDHTLAKFIKECALSSIAPSKTGSRHQQPKAWSFELTKSKSEIMFIVEFLMPIILQDIKFEFHECQDKLGFLSQPNIIVETGTTKDAILPSFHFNPNASSPAAASNYSTHQKLSWKQTSLVTPTKHLEDEPDLGSESVTHSSVRKQLTNFVLIKLKRPSSGSFNFSMSRIKFIGAIYSLPTANEVGSTTASVAMLPQAALPLPLQPRWFPSSFSLDSLSNTSNTSKHIKSTSFSIDSIGSNAAAIDLLLHCVRTSPNINPGSHASLFSFRTLESLSSHSFKSPNATATLLELAKKHPPCGDILFEMEFKQQKSPDWTIASELCSSPSLSSQTSIQRLSILINLLKSKIEQLKSSWEMDTAAASAAVGTVRKFHQSIIVDHIIPFTKCLLSTLNAKSHEFVSGHHSLSEVGIDTAFVVKLFEAIADCEPHSYGFNILLSLLMLISKLDASFFSAIVAFAESTRTSPKLFLLIAFLSTSSILCAIILRESNIFTTICARLPQPRDSSKPHPAIDQALLCEHLNFLHIACYSETIKRYVGAQCLNSLYAMLGSVHYSPIVTEVASQIIAAIIGCDLEMSVLPKMAQRISKQIFEFNSLEHRTVQSSRKEIDQILRNVRLGMECRTDVALHLVPHPSKSNPDTLESALLDQLKLNDYVMSPQLNTETSQSALAITEDLTGVSTGHGSTQQLRWKTAICSNLLSSGIFYWEIKFSRMLSGGNIIVGVCEQSHDLNQWIGQSAANIGWGFHGAGSSGYIYHGGFFANYGKSTAEGDSVGILLDLIDGTISFSLNGVSMGVAYSNLKGQEVYPAVSLIYPADAVRFSTNIYCIRSKNLIGPKFSTIGRPLAACDPRYYLRFNQGCIFSVDASTIFESVQQAIIQAGKIGASGRVSLEIQTKDGLWKSLQSELSCSIISKMWDCLDDSGIVDVRFQILPAQSNPKSANQTKENSTTEPFPSIEIPASSTSTSITPMALHTSLNLSGSQKIDLSPPALLSKLQSSGPYLVLELRKLGCFGALLDLIIHRLSQLHTYPFAALVFTSPSGNQEPFEKLSPAELRRHPLAEFQTIQSSTSDIEQLALFYQQFKPSQAQKVKRPSGSSSTPIKGGADSGSSLPQKLDKSTPSSTSVEDHINSVELNMDATEEKLSTSKGTNFMESEIFEVDTIVPSNDPTDGLTKQKVSSTEIGKIPPYTIIPVGSWIQFLRLLQSLVTIDGFLERFANSKFAMDLLIDMLSVINSISHLELDEKARTPDTHWKRTGKLVQSITIPVTVCIEILTSMLQENPSVELRTAFAESQTLGLLMSYLSSVSGTPNLLPSHPAFVKATTDDIHRKKLLDQMRIQQQKDKDQATSSKSKPFWAKGTGYGTSLDDEATDKLAAESNSRAALGIKAALDTTVCMLDFVYFFLLTNPEALASVTAPANVSMVAFDSIEMKSSDQGNKKRQNPLPDTAYDILVSSCLIPLIDQHLKNDSTLDMARNMIVYDATFNVLWMILQHDYLLPFTLAPVSLNSSSNLRKSLFKLHNVIVGTQKKLGAKKLRNPQVIVNGTSSPTPSSPSRLRTPTKLSASPAPKSSSSASSTAHEVQLEQQTVLLNLIAMLEQDAVAKVDTLTQEVVADTIKAKLNLKDINILSTVDSSMQAELSTEEDLLNAQYRSKLAEHQFGEMEMRDPTSQRYQHHYHDSIISDTNTSSAKMTRLSHECGTFLSGLPLHLSSSVFLRVDTERLDVMKVIITGPSSTPYENGIFIFDVYCPSEFPKVPPLVHLETTGMGSVRFNPNLYNCGKVCLSLLGTWRGSPDEMWQESSSTLLQVFISIQSLIFVDEPYFNEPGHEQSLGTELGQRASKDYNETIRISTLKWAVIDLLTNPPHGFETVVTEHFKLKRIEIMKTCKKWLEEAQSSSSKSFYESLHAVVTELKPLLQALEPFEFEELAPAPAPQTASRWLAASQLQSVFPAWTVGVTYTALDLSNDDPDIAAEWLFEAAAEYLLIHPEINDLIPPLTDQ